jgi:hypothetical protein
MADLTTEHHHEFEEKVQRDLRLDLFRGAGPPNPPAIGACAAGRGALP